MYTVL
jgi:hypothetical protein